MRREGVARVSGLTSAASRPVQMDGRSCKGAGSTLEGRLSAEKLSQSSLGLNK